jgi:DNA-binding PadR family transcriptional regulator
MVSEMRGPTYLVLAALAVGRLHGYGIMQEAAAIAPGAARLKVGSLYATLDRLESDGLVATDGEEAVDGRLRRYYRLTEHGAGLLAQETRARITVGNEVLHRLGLNLSGGTL